MHAVVFTSLIMVLSLIQGKGVTIEWLLSWTESENKCMLSLPVLFPVCVKQIMKAQ